MFGAYAPSLANRANIRQKESVMSNVKHSKCAMRDMAKSAKARLASKNYDQDEIGAPKNLTPQQRDIYLKLVKLTREGEDVIDPIAKFADSEKIRSLNHEERQRYVLSLCADYIQIKGYIRQKSQSVV